MSRRLSVELLRRVTGFQRSSSQCVHCTIANSLCHPQAPRSSFIRRSFASSLPTGPAPQKIQRIERILERKVGDLTNNDIQHVADNIVRICRPISSRQGKVHSFSLQRARRLFDRLLAENMVRPKVIIPERAWNALLKVYANNPDMEMVSEPAHVTAHNILLRIQELHKQSPEVHPPASDYQISQVLRACANENSDEACELAEGLIRALEEIGHTLTLEMYNNVMMLYSKRAPYSYDALGKAEDLLTHMAKRSAEVMGSPPPNTLTFNLVLIAWKDCPDELGAARALEVLELMMKLGEDNESVRPDPASFGIVIGAFGNRGQPRNSHVVLEKAFTYFTDNFDPSKALPDLSQCWTNTCFSWAKSGFPQSPLRVEELLHLAQVIRTTKVAKKCTLAPNTAMHAAVLESYLISGRLDRVDRAHQHLLEMVENAIKSPQSYENEWPSTREFASVIHAWFRRYSKVDANDPERHVRAATHAEKLLQVMIELSERKPPFPCSPEANHFMHCIKMWCDASNAFSQREKSQKMKKEEISDALKAARNAVNLLNMAESRKVLMYESYLYVINALSKTGQAAGAFEAAGILKRLEMQRDRKHVDWSRYAAGLYTAVISALGTVQSLEAAELARTILKDISPTGSRAVVATSQTYTAVLSAYSKLPLDRRNIKRSCEVVLDVYNTVKELDRDLKSRVQLDRVVFERVLCTLAKSNDTEMARQSVFILSFMYDLYRDGGRSEAEPTEVCMDACLEASMNAGNESILNDAIDILKRIVNTLHSEPSRHLPHERYFSRIVRRCRHANMKDHAAYFEGFVHSLKSRTDGPQRIFAY